MALAGRRRHETPVSAEHCRELLEDFKVPKFVKFTSSLPKTAGGKIKRSAENR